MPRTHKGRTRSMKVWTDPDTGKQTLQQCWDDTGERVGNEDATYHTSVAAAAPDPTADPLEEDDEESTEGELCDICGAGPFQRLATHKARVHG